MLTDGLAPWVTGGMQQHSAMLVKHLAPLCDHITLVHSGPINGHPPPTADLMSELSLPPHVDVIGLSFDDPGGMPGHYVQASRRYSRAIRRAVGDALDFDAIYAQGFTGVAFADHPRLVVNLHGLEMFQPSFSVREAAGKALLRPLARTLLRTASHVISLGGRLTPLIEACGTPTEAIAQIPNGIPRDWVNPQPAKRRDGPLRVGFIGRNEPRKGFDLFLEAMRRVKGAVEWHVVGPFEPVEGDATTFHGEIRSRKGMMELLDEMDVVAVPSRAEGMPTVILEALSRGCHVVATDVGATAEVLAGAPGCRLIAPSVAELVQAIEEFAGHPPERRTFDLARFDWGQIAREHVRLFQRIAKEGSE